MLFGNKDSTKKKKYNVLLVIYIIKIEIFFVVKKN